MFVCSVCSFVCLFVRLFVCLFVCLFVWLFVCLFVSSFARSSFVRLLTRSSSTHPLIHHHPLSPQERTANPAHPLAVRIALPVVPLAARRRHPLQHLRQFDDEARRRRALPAHAHRTDRTKMVGIVQSAVLDGVYELGRGGCVPTALVFIAAHGLSPHRLVDRFVHPHLRDARPVAHASAHAAVILQSGLTTIC